MSKSKFTTGIINPAGAKILKRHNCNPVLLSSDYSRHIVMRIGPYVGTPRSRVYKNGKAIWS